MSKTLSDLPTDLHQLILSHDEEKIQLKKENDKLKTRVKMLQCLLEEARQGNESEEDDSEDEEYSEDESEDPDRCVRCDRTFNQRKTIFNDGDCAKLWELHCDIGDDEGDLCAACLGKWEDEKTLKALSCDALKNRLRAINQPVKGRKADLIKRILEHEELKEALFKED